jgi:hypothetical protein
LARLGLGALGTLVEPQRKGLRFSSFERSFQSCGTIAVQGLNLVLAQRWAIRA